MPFKMALRLGGSRLSLELRLISSESVKDGPGGVEYFEPFVWCAPPGLAAAYLPLPRSSEN